MTDLRQLILVARKAGWSVHLRPGGHLCWRAPGGGAQVFSASSPGDWRNLSNIKASLRRHGLDMRDGGRRHDA